MSKRRHKEGNLGQTKARIEKPYEKSVSSEEGEAQGYPVQGAVPTGGNYFDVCETRYGLFHAWAGWKCTQYVLPSLHQAVKHACWWTSCIAGLVEQHCRAVTIQLFERRHREWNAAGQGARGCWEDVAWCGF